MEHVVRQECLVFVKTDGSLLKFDQWTYSDTSFPDVFCHTRYQNIRQHVYRYDRNQDTTILEPLKYNEEVVHHSISSCGEVEVRFHSFLTTALDGGEGPVSLSDRFTPRKNFYIHFIETWVCSRTGLCVPTKTKIAFSCEVLISGSSAPRQTLYYYTH
jgi:hypothetical protein